MKMIGPRKHNRNAEYSVAVASFIAAVIFAFASLYISEDHEVAAGNCTVIAQFLLLTASIFGIDYKLNSYGKTENYSGNAEPQSTEHPQR